MEIYFHDDIVHANFKRKSFLRGKFYIELVKYKSHEIFICLLIAFFGQNINKIKYSFLPSPYFCLLSADPDISLIIFIFLFSGYIFSIFIIFLKGRVWCKITWHHNVVLSFKIKFKLKTGMVPVFS